MLKEGWLHEGLQLKLGSRNGHLNIMNVIAWRFGLTFWYDMYGACTSGRSTRVLELGRRQLLEGGMEYLLLPNVGYNVGRANFANFQRQIHPTKYEVHYDKCSNAASCIYGECTIYNCTNFWSVVNLKLSWRCSSSNDIHTKDRGKYS